MRFVTAAFALTGASLMLLGAVGVLRLPDVFARMHAGTKATALGLALVLVAAAASIGDARTAIKAIIAIVLQLAMAPVAAHLIGRGAYRSGVPFWEGTLYDELEGRYDELD